MRDLVLGLLSFGILALPSCGAAVAADHTAPASVIAVIDFDYTDGSGEVRDQREEHRERLAAFMTALRKDLAAHIHVRVVTPICQGAPCTSEGTSKDDLLAAARAAGASTVLLGGIHKMSTLVQWASADAIDAATGHVLFHKLFSFRGDNDEAWRRAESFIANEIIALPPS